MNKLSLQCILSSILYLLSLTLFIIYVAMGNLVAQEIKVVGSSTVYPFSTIITENFSNKNPNFNTPIIEATGTGGGFKMFCQGLSSGYPDIVNASRKIKPEEVQLCSRNGINDILEINIGNDAIVIVAPKSLENLDLSLEQIFLALAHRVPDSKGNLIKNPYNTWSDISPDLPNVQIKVMGPPSTSGTRDSFIELGMHKGCEMSQARITIKETSKELAKFCSGVRTDGAWINGGENDILLIRKVAASKNTLAILGYSFYEQNQKSVSVVKIAGITPNPQSFNNKNYPLFRPLFMYFKGERLGITPGLKEFAQEALLPQSIGPKGYLVKAGLIPLGPVDYQAMVDKVNAALE
ncbi:Phosphate-binding protein PstS precursor [Candidatus Hepatincolaceae symbiont of Richtersius coronifer]